MIINFVFEKDDSCYCYGPNNQYMIKNIKAMLKYLKQPGVNQKFTDNWDTLKLIFAFKEINWKDCYGNDMQLLKSYRLKTAHPQGCTPAKVESTFVGRIGVQGSFVALSQLFFSFDCQFK